jgi:hypothetical protein
MAADPNYKSYYAQDYTQALDKYNQLGTKAGVDFGNINFLKPVDVRETIEKPIFDQVTADGEVGLNGQYIVKNKAISLKKIFDLSNANTEQYLSNRQVQMDLNNALSTPEGKKEVDARFNIHLEELQNTGAITAAEAKKLEALPLEYKYAQNRLLGAGKERVFNEKDLSANQVAIHAADRQHALQLARAKAGEKETELYNTRTGNSYNQNTQELAKRIASKDTKQADVVSLETYKDSDGKNKSMVATSIPKNRAEEVYKFAFHMPNDKYDKRVVIGNHSIRTTSGIMTDIPNGEILALLPKGAMKFGQMSNGQYAAQGVSYATVSQATWEK